MNRRFINIGFGNLINSDKLLAVISPDSAPAKRIIQKAKENDSLIDATQGRRTKSVLITDTGQVVLSSLQPDTLGTRLDTEHS